MCYELVLHWNTTTEPCWLGEPASCWFSSWGRNWEILKAGSIFIKSVILFRYIKESDWHWKDFCVSAILCLSLHFNFLLFSILLSTPRVPCMYRWENTICFRKILYWMSMPIINLSAPKITLCILLGDVRSETLQIIVHFSFASWKCQHFH